MQILGKKTYCSGLTTGSYTWRLPDIKTLYSLIQFSGKDPSGTTGCSIAGSPACVTATLTSFINTIFFEVGLEI